MSDNKKAPLARCTFGGAGGYCPRVRQFIFAKSSTGLVRFSVLGSEYQNEQTFHSRNLLS